MSKKSPGAGPFEGLRALRDELERKGPEPTGSARKKPEREGPEHERPRQSAAAPPTDDDALVLHRLFAGVKPLSRGPGRVPRQRVERSTAAERASKRTDELAAAEGGAVHEHMRLLVDGNVRFEVRDDGRTVEGRRLDIPLEVVRKLRRGMVPIDAQVDLHGMRLQEARIHLEFFLRTMRARRERCVLVIHGKGEHSPSGLGVLRGEISAWLSQGRASEHVAAFATARREDGGEGAMYVLLRR